MRQSEERALALAGLFQSCHLVAGVARSGLIAQDSLAGSLECIFVVNPDSALDVYRSGNGVRTGFRLVMDVLGDLQLSEHGDTLRYVSAVLALEKKLRAQPQLLRAIGAGISGITEHMRSNELDVASEEVVGRLSDLYETTAGTIQPRIRVLGAQKHLQIETNTGRIRALLMSAIRSAVLWRQLDGRMTQWVLGRKRILSDIEKLAEIVC